VLFHKSECGVHVSVGWGRCGLGAHFLSVDQCFAFGSGGSFDDKENGRRKTEGVGRCRHLFAWSWYRFEGGFLVG